MRVLGCDCSSKLIGCVQINSGKTQDVYVAMLQSDDSSYEARYDCLYALIKDLLDTWKPDMVYIEQAVYLQNPKVSFMIDGVVNAVRCACIELKIARQIVDNKSWKKDILGNGKASKAQIMDFAKAKWGEIIKTQDEADAACLALYGWRRVADAGD